MSGKCLLDTNIVIALFANETPVKENLAKTEEVFIPSVIIGELYYGAHKSARARKISPALTILPATVLYWGAKQKHPVYMGK